MTRPKLSLFSTPVLAATAALLLVLAVCAAAFLRHPLGAMGRDDNFRACTDLDEMTHGLDDLDSRLRFFSNADRLECVARLSEKNRADVLAHAFEGATPHEVGSTLQAAIPRPGSIIGREVVTDLVASLDESVLVDGGWSDATVAYPALTYLVGPDSEEGRVFRAYREAHPDVKHEELERSFLEHLETFEAGTPEANTWVSWTTLMDDIRRGP